MPAIGNRENAPLASAHRTVMRTDPWEAVTRISCSITNDVSIEQ